MSQLKPKATSTAAVTPLQGTAEGQGWHLEIAAGPKGDYRLAQVDDYTEQARGHFPWRPPLILQLSARASAAEIPGTWGFGLWNDPFSLKLGIGGGVRRFPALPQTAWFFHASHENYLSFRDDKPAQGFLAQTFRSPDLPAAILALGSLLMPLLAWHKTAQAIRSLLGRIIEEDSVLIRQDITQWHDYTLQWTANAVRFEVDGKMILSTVVSPDVRLGLVIWIDNQYAAFPPTGKLAYGTLENPGSAWMDVKDLTLQEWT